MTGYQACAAFLGRINSFKIEPYSSCVTLYRNVLLGTFRNGMADLQQFSL